MSKDDRREKIVDIIRNMKSVTSEELSQMFNVTEETIRKDLTYLSKEGHIIRTFGGATIVEEADKPIGQRTIHNYVQKQKIAYEALKMISDNDIIVMDSGSTTVVMARHIPANSGVVILTNSIEAMNVLGQTEGITVLCTGGKLRPKSMSLQGINAEKDIDLYNYKKAFITCVAIDINKGIMDANEAEARLKMRMINGASEVYLLADSSKFSNMAHITTCSLDKITAIITDDGIDPQVVEQFERAGTKVIVAGE